MENLIEFISSWKFDFGSFWKAALILLLGTVIMGFCGRFVFGKRSTLNHAVSCAIGIIFIYAITVILECAGAGLEQLIAPLPYVEISGDRLTLFSFADAHFTVICEQIVNMITLAFLVNIVDSLLPKGKNLFSWLLFRLITVIASYMLHLLTVTLLAAYLPDVVITYAPMILLGILILLLLTGVLKILIGAAIATVNPIIGGLYTFFFANIVGKQITKAVITTLILSLLVIALSFFGVDTVFISADALIAYIPFALVLLFLWYIVFRVL